MIYLQLNADNVVVNVIVWDGKTFYQENGLTMLPADEHPNVWLGWQLINNEWIPPTYLAD
jgi:hypothetical protein